jgi:malate/lactate dehydrogenase
MLIGWYDIPDGVVFSFPVTMHPKGYWNVVQDIELTEEMKAAIKLTVQVKYY